MSIFRVAKFGRRNVGVGLGYIVCVIEFTLCVTCSELAVGGDWMSRLWEWGGRSCCLAEPCNRQLRAAGCVIYGPAHDPTSSRFQDKQVRHHTIIKPYSFQPVTDQDIFSTTRSIAVEPQRVDICAFWDCLQRRLAVPEDFLDCLILEDGTHSLYRNVWK
jgi:hypothetical protein